MHPDNFDLIKNMASTLLVIAEELNNLNKTFTSINKTLTSMEHYESTGSVSLRIYHSNRAS